MKNLKLIELLKKRFRSRMLLKKNEKLWKKNLQVRKAVVVVREVSLKILRKVIEVPKRKRRRIKRTSKRRRKSLRRKRRKKGRSPKVLEKLNMKKILMLIQK